MRNRTCFALLAFGAGLLAGCEGRTAILPNSDQALRKSPAKFAADAARRDYKADAPRGEDGTARAEADYTLKELLFANLSGEDWKDVEIWVNRKYVVFLPTLPKSVKAEGYRHIKFQMLYDNQGEHFPASLLSSKVRVEKVEVYRDGKMYDVPVKLAD